MINYYNYVDSDVSLDMRLRDSISFPQERSIGKAPTTLLIYGRTLTGVRFYLILLFFIKIFLLVRNH
jgi:hypothetical protein